MAVTSAVIDAIGAIGAAMPGGRGIALESRLAPDLGNRVVVIGSDYTAVQAGQETILEVPVADLPKNANVTSCTAALHVGGPVGLHLALFAPSPTSTGITIKESGSSSSKSYSVDVDAPARPRNVTVRLEGGDVFFRYGDQLSNQAYALPDFSANLNAYLDAYTGALPVVLRFVLTSDAQGSAKIDSVDPRYSRIQTQTWPNPADGTTRVDRSFDLDFGDLRDTELLPLPSDGSHGRLVNFSADVTGTFGPERSLGSATLADAGGEFATVDPDFGVAQVVRPEIDAQCVGLSLALDTDAGATVYAGLYADADGEPDMTAAALAETQLQLEPSDGVARWRRAAFDAPVALRSGTPVWVVCRGIQGSARIAVSRAALRLLESMRVSRGGHLWRPLSHDGPDTARALVRLTYLPGPENAAAAVELLLRSTDTGEIRARTPLDPTAQPQSLRLPVPDVADHEHVRAEILSSAVGTLTLANVIQEYV